LPEGTVNGWIMREMKVAGHFHIWIGLIPLLMLPLPAQQNASLTNLGIYLMTKDLHLHL
jgi:hypothetical protein